MTVGFVPQVAGRHDRDTPDLSTAVFADVHPQPIGSHRIG